MKNLRAYRIKRGMTQQQLAQKSGVNYTRVNRYENGMGNPTLESMEKLAAALGVTVPQLLEGEVDDHGTARDNSAGG